MKAIEKKKLILSLIKDDLINAKLVHGLNEMGLIADPYFLQLSDTVFKLMGFKEGKKSDRAFERYMDLSKKATQVDISLSHKPMEKLALKIYKEIVDEKI